MSPWVCVLAVLAALTALVCLTPVGLMAQRRRGEAPLLHLRVGPLRIRLLPQEDRPRDKGAPKEGGKDAQRPPGNGAGPARSAGPQPLSAQEEAALAQACAPPSPPPGEKAEKKEKKRRPWPTLDLDAAKSAARALGPPLMKALRRLGRGVRIHPLDVTVVLGGAGDPAGTAAVYGRLQGALWSLMPRLEQRLRLSEPHVCITVDFTQEESGLWGRAGVSVRVGTLLGIAVSLALPTIRWLRSRKKASAAGKDGTHGHGKKQAAA